MNDKALQQSYQPGILSITQEVQCQLDEVLGHDVPHWWALNSCLCCHYEVCHIHSYSLSTDSSKLLDEP
jgi:hypothetical protein